MDVSGTSVLRYVAAVFRNHFLLLAVGGAVFAGSLGYAVLARRVYESTMKILVQSHSVRSTIDPRSADRVVEFGTEATEAQVDSEVELLQSADLVEGLVRYRDEKLLNRRTPNEGSPEMAQELTDVQHRLEVHPIGKSNMIEVSLKDEDAAEAQLGLKWLSAAFLSKQKRDEIALDKDAGGNEVVATTIEQDPTLSWQPVRPRRALAVLVGFVTACIVSLGCVLLKDAMRETAFTPAEVEAMLTLPVLATVPERRAAERMPAFAAPLPTMMKVRPSETVAKPETTIGELDCPGGRYAQQ